MSINLTPVQARKLATYAETCTPSESDFTDMFYRGCKCNTYNLKNNTEQVIVVRDESSKLTHLTLLNLEHKTWQMIFCHLDY